MRAALAIIAGILAALVVQSGVDWISSQFYPYAISDMWDRRQISEAMAARPTGALLLTVLSYFFGGLAGGMVGKLMYRRAWACWTPVGIFSLTALAIALAYPIAEWAGLGSFVAALIGGLVANHLVEERSTVITSTVPPAEPDLDSGA